jgi:hypothetical protein
LDVSENASGKGIFFNRGGEGNGEKFRRSQGQVRGEPDKPLVVTMWMQNKAVQHFAH